MLLPIGKSIWTGKGPFNNYVDKMRVERAGQKMSVFVHAQGIKTVHLGGGTVSVFGNFCPKIIFHVKSSKYRLVYQQNHH